MKKPRHILITGASSGLGAALAEAYAAPETRLSLQGRNLDRLNQVAARAERLGAHVSTKLLDVTNAEDMAAWIVQSDKIQPLDLVIANAGISANTGLFEESGDVTAIFATNVTGVFNTLHPVLPLMKNRKYGQVAIMSSLASFRGAPGAGAYCASKAAVRLYGEALRPELALDNVEVNVICPGFVKTPLTDKNHCPMPFLMAPERAAQIIKKGLAVNRARISFPWPMVALVKIYASLPFDFIERCMMRLPRKSV